MNVISSLEEKKCMLVSRSMDTGLNRSDINNTKKQSGPSQ